VFLVATSMFQFGRRSLLLSSVGLTVASLRLQHTSASAASSVANLQVIFIRHGEKPNDKSFIGLNDQGWNRAFRLPGYLKTILKENDPSNIRIFAMKQKIESDTMKGHSRRPIETILPFADGLGLAVNDTFNKDKQKKLIEEITCGSYAGKSVVVCWESDALREICLEFADKFNTKEPAKDAFNFKGGFSKVVVFSFDKDGDLKKIDIRDQDSDKVASF
jgi:broad specificity phosphatase PhoE